MIRERVPFAEDKGGRSACLKSDVGVAMLREYCRGVAREIVTGDSISITALAHMGNIDAWSRRLPAAIRDGDPHDDPTREAYLGGRFFRPRSARLLRLTGP